MDELTTLPWEIFKNLGAIGVATVAVLMVLRGTLATPRHQKVLTDENAYLRTVVTKQQEAISVQAENLRTVENIAKVVDMTMGAINRRTESVDSGGGDAK